MSTRWTTMRILSKTAQKLDHGYQKEWQSFEKQECQKWFLSLDASSFMPVLIKTRFGKFYFKALWEYL